MSSTLLRLGMWILVIGLALYVIHDSFEDSPVAEFVPMVMLQRAIGVAILLMAAGLALRIFERGAKAVTRHRCQVCRTPIPVGAIYCRAHLRKILHEEDERTHMNRLRH